MPAALTLRMSPVVTTRESAMSTRRTITGLLLIVVLASLGVAMIVIPPWIVQQLAVVREAGPVWVYVYFAVVGLGGALLLGCTLTIVWKLWRATRAKQRRRTREGKNPSQLTRQEKEREIAENLAAVEDLKSELAPGDGVRGQLDPLAEKVLQKQARQKLEIVAFGAISSGKSSLLNALAGRDIFTTDPKGGTTLRRNEIPWPGLDQVMLVDTPGLGEVDGSDRGQLSADAAKDADLVLVVVDGPLREWEFELLRQLNAMEKRTLICLNKEDWYDEHERDRLLGQIRTQLQSFLPPQDVVAVRAQETQRPRVRVSADGSRSEEIIAVEPDIRSLAGRMLEIVQRDGRDLLLANLLLQSRGLVEEARRRAQASLDARAWQIVEKYMWTAGGAAALSPFPLLDLAAGCAISSKMVLDLARVYRQDIDVNTAVTLLAELGKNLLSILGVTAATPAITAAVASLLKTIPGAGTIAGGFLAGIVQALITRWIGAVFVEYFRGEMQQTASSLTAVAREQWQRLTTVDELRKLLRDARTHLGKESPRQHGDTTTIS
jgi:small GTP-binding protein